MLLDLPGRLTRDPGGERRHILEDLPYFEYSMPPEIHPFMSSFAPPGPLPGNGACQAVLVQLDA